MTPHVLALHDWGAGASDVPTSVVITSHETEPWGNAPFFPVEICAHGSEFLDHRYPSSFCFINDKFSVGQPSYTFGTYHLSGAPDTSWADFARAIMAAAGLSCRIVDIPSSAYPTPATRPANSRLDCSATSSVFGIDRPDWQDATRAIITSLTQRKGTA